MDAAVDRMGSQELYVEIARVFARSLPETEKAIAEAMGKSALAEARRLAHSMKSNCATMGAECLRSRISTFEKACAAGDEAEANKLFPSLCDGLHALREELLAL